ncbi:hypothetical protein A0H81_01457 [Grifola frondosa]|uniref:HNH nuclease domain-containing protein n=1 Tax=Grifola frondosa TaxID=5627 RepID=A0A1C7MSR1_GRIFR|nr:hypothetical protein A0H81_01457 [Grifola frondosa]
MDDVTLRNHDGDILSSFWQYGLINWNFFYDCLNTIIFSSEAWFVVDGTPINVCLTAQHARTRHPTTSNTACRQEAYRMRTRVRDQCCLISGLQVIRNDYVRLKAAHIFPRAHDIEWVDKGYQSLITDTAPIADVGGAIKIDSIQNTLLLRSDLHDAWDSYRFGVNADAGYIVIPFVAGYDDIAGKILKLDHITDPTIRPLDDLLRDHFLQCVLKNMKGAGEPNWDYEDALDDGSMDLSRSDIWGSKEGQAHLEFELAHRLYPIRVGQRRDLRELIIFLPEA